MIASCVGNLLPCLLLSPGPVAEGESGIPLSPDQMVLVERGHLPVVVRPLTGLDAIKDRCVRIGPADLELFRAGQPLRVTAIGPRPLPRTHALLIDTSRSMVERLDDVRKAAIAYIEALPAGDAVLVASFDESLILGTPATRDRAEAIRAVERIQQGYFTALWDAVHYLVGYVETLPGEKIVVLLTDGEDSSSMRFHRFEDVLQEAATARNLTVFSIGYDLPESVARGVPTARGKLGRLSDRTGGAFFEADRIDEIGPVLDRIRRRLDERLYVSYVPQQLPTDTEESSSVNRRGSKFRVGVRESVPCRVTLQGAPGRYASRRLGTTSSTIRVSPESDDIDLASRIDSCAFSAGPDSWQDGVRLASSDSRLRGFPTTFYPVADGRALVGRTTDLLQERGPLFQLGPYLRSGRLRIDQQRSPIRMDRDIEVLTPPLEELRLRLDDPARVLLYLLRRDLCPPALPGLEPVRAPFLVHGQTFLELRELLGRAMYEARQDYRDWASIGVEETCRIELTAMIEQLPAAARPDRSRQEVLLRALVEQRSDPEHGRPHARLGEWIRDVPIVDAAAELERRMAESWLTGEISETTIELRQSTDLVIERWSRLGRWFPPALHVRILTPLVPGYDRERDRVGFYRFTLPWPQMLERAPQVVPTDPLGLVAARHLVVGQATAIAPESVRRLRSIEQRAVRKRDAGCPGAVQERKAILEIEDAGGRVLQLVAYFAASDLIAGGPACVDVVDPAARPGDLDRPDVQAWKRFIARIGLGPEA